VAEPVPRRVFLSASVDMNVPLHYTVGTLPARGALRARVAHDAGLAHVMAATPLYFTRMRAEELANIGVQLKTRHDLGEVFSHVALAVPRGAVRSDTIRIVDAHALVLPGVEVRHAWHRLAGATEMERGRGPTARHMAAVALPV